MVQEQGRPDINIVCEKVAFQGLTRFEDRHSLPLGVSSNFTAYSAKLLTQARPLPNTTLLAGFPFLLSHITWLLVASVHVRTEHSNYLAPVKELPH